MSPSAQIWNREETAMSTWFHLGLFTLLYHWSRNGTFGCGFLCCLFHFSCKKNPQKNDNVCVNTKSVWDSQFKFKSQVILHFLPEGCQEKLLSDMLLWLKTSFFTFRVGEINAATRTTDEAIFRYRIFRASVDFSIK